MTWITTSFNSGSIDSTKATEHFLMITNEMCQCYGLGGAVKRVKSLRLAVTRWLSGVPLKKNEIQFRLTSDGLPVILGPILDLVRGSPEHKKLALTILYSTRTIVGQDEADLKPIEDVSTADITETIRYIPGFWRSFIGRKKPKSFPKWTSFHLSTKTGPNGHALVTSLTDLLALSDKQKEAIKLIGGEDLKRRIEFLDSNLVPTSVMYHIFGCTPGGNTRKLSVIQDKEMKTRVIGIFDYWSQSALYPLHKWIFTILRALPGDCTFDQNSFRSKLPSKGPYFSMDLSSATDRFPLSLQTKVLEYALGEKYAEAWSFLMSGTAFLLGKDSSRPVWYNAGQPMGAYSSWAMFTLCHHFVMYVCLRKEGLPLDSKLYCILGDDIVIAHKGLAHRYRELMETLGVQISEMKTHVSEDTYEFAKRWVHKGKEISPFPVHGVLEVRRRYNLLLAIIHSTVGKGWIPIISVTESLHRFHSIVIKSSRLRRILDSKIELCWIAMKLVWDSIDASGAMRILQRLYNLPIISSSNHTIAKAMVDNACVDLFSQSMESEGTGSSKVIFVLCVLTDPESGISPDLHDAWKESLPWFGIQGHFEEMYLKITKESYQIDLTGADWPWLARAVTIPNTDDIFSVRNYHAQAMASASLAKALKERAFTLAQNPYF